jgi:hypothetical protein
LANIRAKFERKKRNKRRKCEGQQKIHKCSFLDFKSTSRGEICRQITEIGKMFTDVFAGGETKADGKGYWNY